MVGQLACPLSLNATIWRENKFGTVSFFFLRFFQENRDLQPLAPVPQTSRCRIINGHLDKIKRLIGKG